MCLGPEIALLVSVIGGVASAGSAVYGMVQGQKQAAASQRAEKLRNQQMQMEQRRKRIESIRRMQSNRAMAVSNIAGATGSLEGSAYGGATSANSSILGAQLGEIETAGAFGQGIFEANAAYSQASANMQTAEGIGSFGKSIFGSSEQIGRIGATLFNRPA